MAGVKFGSEFWWISLRRGAEVDGVCWAIETRFLVGETDMVQSGAINGCNCCRRQYCYAICFVVGDGVFLCACRL